MWEIFLRSQYQKKLFFSWAAGLFLFHGHWESLFPPLLWPLRSSELNLWPTFSNCTGFCSMHLFILIFLLALSYILTFIFSTLWFVHLFISVCMYILHPFSMCNIWLNVGSPGSSDGKKSTCSAGDLCSVPGLGRSSGGGHGNPLQCSCLENPMAEEPGGLQSMGSQRAGDTWALSTCVRCVSCESVYVQTHTHVCVVVCVC